MYTIFYLIGIYALTESWPPASIKLASYDGIYLTGSTIYVQMRVTVLAFTSAMILRPPPWYLDLRFSWSRREQVKFQRFRDVTTTSHAVA